jgi:hypothetical protein
MRKTVVFALLIMFMTGCGKEKLTPQRAQVLVDDYVRTHQGTNVTANFGGFSSFGRHSQGLDVETLYNYATDQQTHSELEEFAAPFIVIEFARAGLLNVHSRTVTIPNFTGAYEHHPHGDGDCSSSLQINHESPTSPVINVIAKFSKSLYRTCDWGFTENVTGFIDDSGNLKGLGIFGCSQYALVNNTLRPSCEGAANLDFKRTTTAMPPITFIKYQYSLSDEAKALGLNTSGGVVKIGEMTIDSVDDLLLQGETNAIGQAKFSIRYNKLGSVLMPDGLKSGTIAVSFAQTPDGKWVVTGSERF